MEYFEEFRRCERCYNCRSLYYFDGREWINSGKLICLNMLNVEQENGKGCFKFILKNENEIQIESKNIDAMNIIMEMKIEIEKLKLIIEKFENFFKDSIKM